MDRYMMISQDCHAGAPWYVYLKYLDPEFRDDFTRRVSAYVGMDHPPEQTELEKVKPFSYHTISEDRQKQYLKAMEEREGHLGSWDPDVRAKELDREGIVGEVIFPDGQQKNHAPFGVDGIDFKSQKVTYEQRLAGCRAHNRWLAELCQTNKGRHAGIALVTMDNPEETVREIRWARENGLFGGVLLPPLRLGTDGPENLWHHPRYAPIWQVCEELQMPVNTHTSKAGPIYGGSPLVGSIENDFIAYRPFWMLLWGGVLERHPQLKLCLTESGGMQVLWMNPYFDKYVARYRRPEWVKKAITMPPSEYWRRQCYVGASSHSSRAEIDARHEIGVENIMWGSDYPHPEGTWPASIERTRENFQGIPEDEVRLMVGGNAARVYGFDLAMMNALAEKIGPRIEALGGVPAKAA